MMVKFRKGSGVKMPEESVDKGFAGKIGVVMRVPLKQGLKHFIAVIYFYYFTRVVMRVPLKQGLKRSFSRGYHTFRSCQRCDESSIKTRIETRDLQ